MTEDGETPESESDRDDDRRTSADDRDRQASAEDSEPDAADAEGGSDSDAGDDVGSGDPASRPDAGSASSEPGREPGDGPRAGGEERESGATEADEERVRPGDAEPSGWDEGREVRSDQGGDVREGEPAAAGRDVAAGIEAARPDEGGAARSDEGEGTDAESGAGGTTNQPSEADRHPATTREAVGPYEDDAPVPDVPEDVRSYDRFQKVDRASYDRVNEFLRDRTYITAREWAIARLCADFRTATGVEMTKIGENLPHLVPFMTDTYSPQAVNQARSAFEEKVRMAGATFLYGAMSGFFTADELDDIMYEITEVAKFLLEVEGVELAVDEELDSEDRISAVMREVRRASEELRHEGVECPECGHHFAQTGTGAQVE